MVRRIYISAFLTVIALATSSPGPAPIVIPLKKHTFLNLKTFTSNHTETHNLLVKRLKETLPLTEFSINNRVIFHYGKVSIGTPSTEFHMMFDTGSSDTWITGWGCNVNGKVENGFNPENSYTAISTPFLKKWEYANGNIIETRKYTEKVTIAGFSVPDEDLNVAYLMIKKDLNIPYDGILSMGYSSQSFTNSISFVEKLIERGIISYAAFGFYFERNSQSQNSQLTIGGFDPEHAHELKYYEIVEENQWIIQLNGIRVDDHYVIMRETALIDTGSTDIHGPLHEVMHIFVKIPQRTRIMKMDENTFNVAFKCDAQFSISFVFGDVEYPTSHDITEYPMEPSDFISGRGIKDQSICMGSISGHKDVPAFAWTLGLAFLKNVYTIFDMENDQIGFSLLTTSLGDSRSRASRITLASRNRNSQTSLG